MNAKQKAGELVALFEIIAHPKIDVDKQMAKLCAYKTVEPFRFQSRFEKEET